MYCDFININLSPSGVQVSLISRNYIPSRFTVAIKLILVGATHTPSRGPLCTYFNLSINKLKARPILLHIKKNKYILFIHTRTIDAL